MTGVPITGVDTTPPPQQLLTGADMTGAATIGADETTGAGAAAGVGADIQVIGAGAATAVPQQDGAGAGAGAQQAALRRPKSRPENS